MSILDTATAQTVQELTDVIVAVSSIGIAVLLIYVLITSRELLASAFSAYKAGGTDALNQWREDPYGSVSTQGDWISGRDGMTDTEHYSNAYDKFQGKTYDEFQASYSRSKDY